MTQTVMPKDGKLLTYLQGTKFLLVCGELKRDMADAGYTFTQLDEMLEKASSPRPDDFAVFSYTRHEDGSKYVNNVLLSNRDGATNDNVTRTLRRFGVPVEPAECRPDTRDIFGTEIYYRILAHFSQPFYEELKRMPHIF